MQHFLKAPIRPAGAQVVPPQFLDELLLAADDLVSALHVGFGREAFAAFAATLESRVNFETVCNEAWRTSLRHAGQGPRRNGPLCSRLDPVDARFLTASPNNRLQAPVGGLGGVGPARWACAHRA